LSLSTRAALAGAVALALAPCTPAAAATTYTVGTDWRFDASAVQPGDTVCLPAGNRGALRIDNLTGTADRPVIVKNCGGTAVLTGSTYTDVLFISNSKFFKLTGADAPAGGYGIRLVGDANQTGSGLKLGDGSTNYEVERVEVTGAGFAGIMAKSDPTCDGKYTRTSGFVQRDTIFHDNFVHDTKTGEGFYIGHSYWDGYQGNCPSVVYPHAIVGLDVYRNRTENTAADGIQVGSADAAKVHDNTIVNTGIHPFDNRNDQKNGLQIGLGPQGDGVSQVYNNRIIDAGSIGIHGNVHQDLRLYNNLIVRPGRGPAGQGLKNVGGMYLNAAAPGVDIEAYHNTVVAPMWSGFSVNDAGGAHQDSTFTIVNNIVADPGSWDVYENDNTWRPGANSAYVHRNGPSIPVDLGVGPQPVAAGTDLVGHNLFVRTIDEPRFVNVAVDDYHLRAGSPAIDAAVNRSTPGLNRDLDNRTRPQGTAPDHGAFEYAG